MLSRIRSVPSGVPVRSCQRPALSVPALPEIATAYPYSTAYVNACNGTTPRTVVATTQVALTLPDNWDGPVAQHLSTGATVIYFISVLSIGVGLISIICTM